MTEEETVMIQDLYQIEDMTTPEINFIENLSNYENDRVLNEDQKIWLEDISIKYL